jgi:plasmid stability protein
MTLSLTVPPDVEARLRERAAASGQPLDAYASKILAEAIAAPTIDELLSPARADFANSGMSERKLLDLGRKELNDLRTQKKAKPA